MAYQNHYMFTDGTTFHRLIFKSIIFLMACFFYVMCSINITHAATLNLNGYAWSSNIGWVSMSGPGYNVTIDDVTGAFGGYAWSSNIGWIRFNGFGNACPNGSGCNAQIDSVSKNVKGWARACSGTIGGDCSSMTPRPDGWDGWISLHCTNTDDCPGTNYGWSLSAGELVNYAWGNDVVGWLRSENISTGLVTPTVSLGGRVLGSGNAYSSISPLNINAGEDLELEWSSTGASSCLGSVTGDPAAGGFATGGATSGTISGSITEPSPGTSATYHVTCSNFAGAAVASLTVQTLSTVVEIEATPAVVELGGNVDITWNVYGNDPTFCSITGPNGLSRTLLAGETTGTINNVTISGESDFVLSCTPNGINPGAQDTAKVIIVADFTES